MCPGEDCCLCTPSAASSDESVSRFKRVALYAGRRRALSARITMALQAADGYFVLRGIDVRGGAFFGAALAGLNTAQLYGAVYLAVAASEAACVRLNEALATTLGAPTAVFRSSFRSAHSY